MEQPNKQYALQPREYGALWRLLRDIRHYRAALRLRDLLPRDAHADGEFLLSEEKTWALSPEGFAGGLDRYLQLARSALGREWQQKDREAGRRDCRALIERWMGQRPPVRSGPLKPYFDRRAEAASELEVGDWYRFHQLLMFMEELLELHKSLYARQVCRLYCGDRSKLHQANLFSSLQREYGEELERQVVRLFLLPPRLDQYDQGFREELFGQIVERCGRE